MPQKNQGNFMDDVSHKIGHLEGRLEALIGAFESSDTEARASRSKFYTAQEQMRMEMAAANTKIENVAKTWEDAGPVISDIKKWRERFIGMQMLAAVTGASVLAGAGLIWKWLSLKLGW